MQGRGEALRLGLAVTGVVSLKKALTLSDEIATGRASGYEATRVARCMSYLHLAVLAFLLRSALLPLVGLTTAFIWPRYDLFR